MKMMSSRAFSVVVLIAAAGVACSAQRSSESGGPPGEGESAARLMSDTTDEQANDTTRSEYRASVDGLGFPVPPPPTEAEAAAQIANGEAVIDDEGTTWYKPCCDECYNKKFEPKGVGWIDACAQWAELKFPGSNTRDLALKMTTKCGPVKGGPSLMQVDDCWIRTWPGAGAPSPMHWLFAEPGGTTTGDCRDVSMSYSAGGVSIGTSIKTCQRHKPQKFTAPGDHRATWSGGVYWSDEQREAGFLIGISVPKGTGADIGLYMDYGQAVSYCNFPPAPWDQCNF